MSELAHILADIRNLDSTKAYVDLENERITIRFVLHGQAGRISFRPLPHTKFQSKVYAAAVAMNDGRKPAWRQVPTLLNGPIKPQALKILTNPMVWSVSGLDYGNEKF